MHGLPCAIVVHQRDRCEFWGFKTLQKEQPGLQPSVGQEGPIGFEQLLDFGHNKSPHAVLFADPVMDRWMSLEIADSWCCCICSCVLLFLRYLDISDRTGTRLNS